MFAANALLVGEASRRIDYSWGFFIALLVNSVVAVVFVAVDALLSGDTMAWDPVPLLLFALAGVFATYLGRMLFYVTVVGMGPSRASAFQITQPLSASVLALVFLGQRLSVAQVSLMLLVLGGLFIVNRSRAAVAPEGQAPEAAQPDRLGTVDGAVATVQRVKGMAVRQQLLIAALGSGVAYAAANVLRSAAINRLNEPFVGSLLGALAGLACYLVFNVRVCEVPARLRATERRALVMFMGCGVLSILGQTASIASLRYLPVAIANLFAVSIPIVVVPVSVLLLHNREGVTRRTVIGVLVTWAGVVGMVVV